MKKYILCERWKKVERPLRHSSHLLDLWTAWGQDRQTVRWRQYSQSLSYTTHNQCFAEISQLSHYSDFVIL